jgi:hypoxanthine-DNA glycosylase
VNGAEAIGDGAVDDLLEGLGIEAGPRPAVLVLGTFPSVIARRYRAYYANPQNHFWPIIETLFGIARSLPYRERVSALNERGVALWDMVDACRQEGSMDTTIRDPVLNDVATYLDEHPSIRLVAVNGRTAERFLKRVIRDHPIPAGVRVEILPSTSPANARTSFIDKVRRWTVIRDYAAGTFNPSSQS